MVMILVWLPRHRNVQIVTHLWTTLYIMSYIAFYTPYKKSLSNFQEIFNEWMVLLGAYHLFTFTEWVYDLERRFELGWSLIGTIVINILFNTLIVIFLLLAALYGKIKKCHKVSVKQKRMKEYYKRRSDRRGH